MDERVVQFRVGVVVVATLIIAAIMIAMFSQPGSFFGRTYTIKVILPRAPGITENTPVRKSGILIGRVRSVGFAPDDQVEVTVAINSKFKLYHNERPRVTTSLLGDATLEFMTVDDKKLPRKVMEHGDVVQGLVSSDPLEIVANLEDNLTNTVDALGSAGHQVAQLAERIDNLLVANDEQISGLLEKSERAFDGIATFTDALEKIVGDENVQKNLRQAFNDLPKLLVDTQEAMDGFQLTVQLANDNLNNLAGFTEPLGKRGEDLVDKIDSGLDRLDGALEQLLTFSRAINSQEGSLGKLLNDTELYNNINQAAVNIRTLSNNVNQMTRQLRPIINDVRIITDKVARDPGRVGVSGVLRRRSGVK